MRTWTLLLALTLLATGADAATILRPNAPNATALALVPTPGLPVSLAAGPQGGTVIGVNKTSTNSTVSGGFLATTQSNTTELRNPTASAWKVRLVPVRALGATEQCAVCSLELRDPSGATSAQIAYTPGALPGPGPWVTFSAAGGPTAAWWLHAAARATVAADADVWLHYRLEAVPEGKSSPVVQYENLVMTFRV